MKGHSARSQRLDDISYVDFRATCDTYMKIWQMKVSELLHKLKDLVARRWNPRNVGTFIKSIHYYIDGMLIWQCEHLFQAPCQSVITGLSRAVVVIGIKT
jgi:hypothetical protein